LYAREFIQYFEAQGLIYAISAQVNPRLREAIYQIPESQWFELEEEDGTPISIARIRYQPKTWDRPRTFIISRRLKPDTRYQTYFIPQEKYRYFAYVTNYPRPLLEQYKFAAERCTLEANIKEYKRDFGYDFLPCGEIQANKAYLQYVVLAGNLTIFSRLFSVPPPMSRWSFRCFRQRVLVICGNLIRRGDRYIPSLPTWWP